MQIFSMSTVKTDPTALMHAGPEVIKLFFMLNLAEHENFSANKYEVGIFIFISREIFMLSSI